MLSDIGYKKKKKSNYIVVRMKAEMLLFNPHVAISAAFYNRRTEVHRNQSGGINKNEIFSNSRKAVGGP